MSDDFSWVPEGFRTLGALDSSPPPIPWLLEGVLPLGSVGMLVGPAKSGKTFGALSLGLSLAAGEETWGGCRLLPEGGTRRPERVAYLALEKAWEIERRTWAWRTLHHCAEIPPFVTWERGLNLSEEKQVQEMVDYLARIQPRLVVLDTLWRASGGAHENDAGGGMAVVLNNLARMATESGAAVLALHHTGRGGKDPRGTSAIDGAVEVLLHLGKAPGLGKRRLSVHRMNAGTEGRAWDVTLPLVEGIPVAEVTPRNVEAEGAEDTEGMARTTKRRRGTTDREALGATLAAAAAAGVATGEAATALGWKVPKTSKLLGQLTQTNQAVRVGRRYFDPHFQPSPSPGRRDSPFLSPVNTGERENGKEKTPYPSSPRPLVGEGEKAPGGQAPEEGFQAGAETEEAEATV